jgi:Ulp1 family protease
MYDKKFTYYDSCNNPPVIPPEVHKMISRLKKLSERTSLDWDIASARISIYPNFPQQDGDRDCGVFVLMAARAVANRLPIDFTQADVPYFRQRVAAEIVSGTLYSG